MLDRALAGIFAATRRGRCLIKTHVFGFVKQSWSSIVMLAQRPAELAALFGGSLGSPCPTSVPSPQRPLSTPTSRSPRWVRCTSAPRSSQPPHREALEAAMVAGLTGVGLASGVAVASVLSYRLATYWLPILPGWISLRELERRNII